MSIIFERNILYVKNRDILFDYNIEKVIETNGVFIVLLDIPTKDNTVNNIYGIANDDIIWRIQSYLKIDPHFKQTSYVHILKKEDNKIVAVDFCGSVWTDAASDPIKDIFDWTNNLQATAGITPKRALTSNTILSTLLTHSKVKKDIFGVNTKALSKKELNDFLSA